MEQPVPPKAQDRGPDAATGPTPYSKVIRSRTAFPLSLSPVPGCSLRTSPPPMAFSTDVTVADVETAPLAEGQSVLIENDRIAKIGIVLAPQDGPALLACGRAYLILGLWNRMSLSSRHPPNRTARCRTV